MSGGVYVDYFPSKSPRIDPAMSTESLAMLMLSEKLVLAAARKRVPRGKV